MTHENPYTWQEWVKARLLWLSVLLLLTSSAVFGMAVTETSMTTNGISISILTVALLTTFSAVFGIFSGFVPSFELHHTFLSVVLTIQIAIWLFLTMFELTEVKDIGSKENSYNSSYWGKDSGLSHGCSWADSGRYPDKDSYNRTCSLVKARFSISWVVLRGVTIF
ncbi:hypothetical protein B9Z19DRAFT_1067511 [Tuber borchii]|uniref:Uncharacterized protein n=1 Tax=Tuber borchii TaxID=42251 RepID=A0A2T6ZIL1_TUBBO|nr:hypothetical protein B9Z19DRAFT_1067511 [Tuber borchii]